MFLTVFQSLFWWNVLLNHSAALIGGLRLAFVSILVLVECTSESYFVRGSPRSVAVSILVLVECTSEWAWRIDGGVEKKVSILVLVECTSESKGGYRQSPPHTVFQSLFWWNVLLNKAVNRSQRRPTIGFNPCSGGMYFWITGGRSTSQDGSAFQSLFWWNVLLNYNHHRSIASRHKSFNPCSGGMYFWIPRVIYRG